MNYVSLVKQKYEYIEIMVITISYKLENVDNYNNIMHTQLYDYYNDMIDIVILRII